MPVPHILQVSELTKKVRFILESELNTLWLTGEISNFIAPSSGHWYLSLKDSKSQVRCAMFKGSNRRVSIIPKNGQQVLVRAKVSLYEPRGDFQLIIEQMEDAGIGLLQQQYQQLKEKLAFEGFFSQSAKQPLPKHINKVGVITSPTGAAIKDIITVLQRRNASIEIIIYPSLVQGATAAPQIAHAINLANQRHECDVLLVGRGGGSLEDLWCFNDEVVVKAIYNSKLPIISAVGHEIDTTLSDYAADMRAATPSAGAELVSQDSSETLNSIRQLTQRLLHSFSHQYRLAKQHSLALVHRLSQAHPEVRLLQQQQQLDNLTIRLVQAIQFRLHNSKQRPQQLHKQLLHLSPKVTIDFKRQQILQYQQRLTYVVVNNVKLKSHHFVNLIEQLQLVSPLATIARGYSVTRNKDNKIISSIGQLKKNDEITVQLCDGIINAQVKSYKTAKLSAKTVIKP
jgi:exodeoxyribonuclease VII large subunit